LKDVIFQNHLIININDVTFGQNIYCDVDTKQANETAWGK